jgi:hypothetical protein
MADRALSARQGVAQYLVAAREPPLRPSVIGGQPARETLPELGEACGSPPPLSRS